MKFRNLLFALALTLCLPAMAEESEARLLRFPAVGGGKIVFCYAGDLYSVDINGGTASKLTSHVGYECFPRISPDGKTIAFTGQYDGNTEVYSIPITGGEPRRLTYSALVERDMVGERMGPNNIVMGWTPDGSKVVYRSKQHNFSGLRGRLCLVSAEGGISETIPTSEGGFCSFSPDGSKLAMNRMFREFRTWKYYRGGQADDIWVNTVGTSDLVKITDNDAQDIFPMWVGEEIYYLSDRDRTMNLFCYNTSTKQTRKVTNFTEYDCKFPSYSKDYIVFENGGYIYKYDIRRRGSAEKVSIRLADDDIWSRKEYRSVASSLGGFTLSPDGNRMLAVARGDIYSLPAEKGPVYNISQSPSSHEREVVWSPDGKSVAYLSDKSGEYQVYCAPADDLKNAKCLTSFENGYLSGLAWSPDASKLYVLNKDRTELYEVSPNGGGSTLVLGGEKSRIGGLSFSPDGKWMAYTKMQPNRISAVYLFDLAGKENHQLTDRWYAASSPVFSTDGKYLFFTSDRHLGLQYSGVEWNAMLYYTSNVFIVPLAKDTPNPLKLSSDEYSPSSDVKKEESSTKKDKKGGKSEDKKATTVPATKVDFDGIGQRITALPLEAGNYRLVLADKDKLYYSEGWGGRGLKTFDLKTLRKEDGPEGQVLAFTPDHSKALVRKDGKLSVAPFGAPAGKGGSVPVGDADMIIDHEAEWAQIFDESWRITRDGFYVENMHGTDWQHVHDKYAEMLPYVKHRHDLTYLIGEMLGELNVGHAYITSGETPDIPRIKTGLLGASYTKEASSGAFRIDKIFEGADWNEALLSPLTAPGVDVAVGEYIVEVNGIPAKELSDVGEALIGKVGKTVSLKISGSASGSGARTVYVKPIGDESQLAYYEWVRRNIKIVDDLSGGEIGYIHIPDMGQEGLEMFTRLFYTQLDKKALIIDDRMNGGGNVSPIILERLQREVYRMSMYRNGTNEPVPNEAFYGPKVCLIDKYSSSDGDLFPYGFRKLGLGKLIGTRSWGGIVGISGSKQFVDGQDMRTPFFTSYSTDGEWIIEGHGVDPDIEVDINPFEDYNGKDAQLEKAVSVLQQELKDYKALPHTPAAPVKN